MCANTKRITNFTTLSQVIFIAKSFHLTIKGNFFCEKLFRCFGHWSELLDCFNGFHCLELVFICYSVISRCVTRMAQISTIWQVALATSLAGQQQQKALRVQCHRKLRDSGLGWPENCWPGCATWPVWQAAQLGPKGQTDILT